ncbi:hypothetical protein [uncultured Brevundimonas sp.]
MPPEGVGGTLGFEDFFETAASPGHSDHRTVLDWYGGPSILRTLTG